MKVASDLHIVGSGDAGLNLSGAMDANYYLVDTGDGLWLLDFGFVSVERNLASKTTSAPVMA